VELLGALEASAVASALRRSLILYPVVNALHIFGIALLVGSIAPFDLRALGLFGTVPLAPLARFLPNVAAAGLALAATAGLLLFSVKPLDYVGNPAFLTKVTLVALGVANAVAQRRTAGWRALLAGEEPGARVRLGAALSLVIWCSALMAGRMIAFVD
jgi:hypothetical protein